LSEAKSSLQGMTVCSGIGAPECAAPWIDWRYQSEIEKFPCAVLAARFSHAVNLGDMTKFQEWPDADVDVLCGGTPCQSFSVAGLRKGLADPRGNLMLTYLAIAQRYQPRWIVWENVPGVLSSDGGRDFGTFLGALGQFGYGFAYLVLDAQFVRTQSHPWAVPQRRRRVFVVGYFGDWRRAAAVLLDPESLRWNPAPGRKSGQGTSGSVAPSLVSSGRGVERTGETRGQDPVVAVPSTGDVSHYLNAGGMGRIDYETETFVTHALRGEGFDASEDGTGRGTPLVPVAFRTTGNDGAYETGDVVGALTTTTDPNAQVVAFSAKDHGGDAMDDCSPTLRAGGHAGSHANAGVMPAVAFAKNQRGELRTSEVSPSLNVGGGKPGEGYPAVAFDLRGREGGAMPEGPHDTANIRAASGGSSRSYVAQPWAVRRLTPLECERLQGFPDGWTDVEYRGKRAADGPRYKALGNSMAVNVMNLIFERIMEVDQR
jgi:DNA (cytosine-5)-methyltransferase 1